MKKPRELLKSFSNRLARSAVSEDGAEALRLLRQAGLLGNSIAPNIENSESDESNSPQNFVAPAIPDGVGIWERKKEDGGIYFVRDKSKVSDWGLWANIGRIGPKKAKRRLVFIGESVARGFLYDPQYNCAMALESILHSRLGKDEIEVIDLARTNLGFEVKELAIATALLLEPDIVTIFSGNNWSPGAPTGSEVAVVDTVLREQGLPGLKRTAERSLENIVIQVVKEVSHVYKSKNIPLVWIIPEFNLGDWRDPITNAPFLQEGANFEWISLRERAEQAFENHDFSAAADLARRMVAIDNGTCVTPLYILAECSRIGGDLEAARHYLEAARDAVIWDTSKNAAPRTYSVTEITLRQEVPKYSNQLVDLPRLFKEHLKGGIPDRRLFVDYCHFTSEGIQVSMAAAACCVLKALKGVEAPWRELMNECLLPSPQIEAETAFLAAIHNAHWWQSYELIQHYCMRAVASSPEIAGLMKNFIDLQTRRTPMLMGRAAEDITALGSPLMMHYLLRFNFQRLDSVLLEALASSLRTLGMEIGDDIVRLRQEEHSVRRSDVNLLDYYFCTEGLQQQETMWVVPHLNDYLDHKMNHYYRAYWIESRFVFVADANSPVHLQLTCRLPNPPLYQGVITLSVNGESVGEISIGEEWETWDISVQAEIVRNGLNKVVIRWPLPLFPGMKPLEVVAAYVMEKTIPEFFFIFGEIHSFVASDGCKQEKVNQSALQEVNAVEVH